MMDLKACFFPLLHTPQKVLDANRTADSSLAQINIHRPHTAP